MKNNMLSVWCYRDDLKCESSHLFKNIQNYNLTAIENKVIITLEDGFIITIENVIRLDYQVFYK